MGSPGHSPGVKLLRVVIVLHQAILSTINQFEVNNTDTLPASNHDFACAKKIAGERKERRPFQNRDTATSSDNYKHAPPLVII